jgi:uncharacterized protein (DUF1330 family)
MDSTTECIIYLLSLKTPLQDFTTILAALPKNQQPFLTTKAVHWVFPPTTLSVNDLTTPHWDVAIFFKAPFQLPPSLSNHAKASWSISFAAPSALLESLPTTQSELSASIPHRSNELDLLSDSDLQGSDAVSSVDSAEITPALKGWIQNFSLQENNPQVIMFNLLTFKDAEKYGKYRDAFVAGVGSRHGARPLLFGEVVSPKGQSNGGKSPWEMAAFIYYPSLLHFADMLASPDYREVSHKYRQGSLVDNPILCLFKI